MGTRGKKMSSFLLTQYTDSCLEIFLNNIIKMWDKFRFLKFPLIVLFILIGGIFLISSSYLVYMFLSIKLKSYGLYIFLTLHRNSELSTIVGLADFFMYPFLLAAIIFIKTYSNAEQDKSTIFSEN